MKNVFTTFLFAFTFIFTSILFAQDFNGTWQTDYVTWDDFNGTPPRNSIGTNTASVAVINNNNFVALASDFGTNCYLVGYANATDSTGQLGRFEYGPSGYLMPWISGFDQINLISALDVTATSDSLIYVANNDPEHNILVFKMSSDTVISTQYRLLTGGDEIHGINVDNNGYVYVTQAGSDSTIASVMIYEGINQNSEWAGSHNISPSQTITLPEEGLCTSVATNANGTILYISNYTAGKVYLYLGDPTSGYTIYNGFNFVVTDTSATGLHTGPTGLAFMEPQNILFISNDSYGSSSSLRSYDYGRVYAVNPNDGTILDTIDIANWNYTHSDSSYSDRLNSGEYPFAAGYTSVFNVKTDNEGNLYTVSYNGWAVEKWSFSGTLPTIPLTITGIVKDNTSPSRFALEQNYPNPFNPSTTIKFSLTKESTISLNVYSITGELVTTLINSTHFSQGSYRITFDASNLASGTYIYTLKNGSQLLSKKMILLK